MICILTYPGLGQSLFQTGVGKGWGTQTHVYIKLGIGGIFYNIPLLLQKGVLKFWGEKIYWAICNCGKWIDL